MSDYDVDESDAYTDSAEDEEQASQEVEEVDVDYTPLERMQGLRRRQINSQQGERVARQRSGNASHNQGSQDSPHDHGRC